MNDRWQYTIPANTAEISKVTEKLKITTGTLTKLIIYFPAGCQGLARCRVKLGLKPVAPKTITNYLAGDDMPIVLDNLDVSIKGNLPELNWELWNVDETYPHTLWLLAEWISEDEPLSMKTYRLTKDLVAVLRAMFRG